MIKNLSKQIDLHPDVAQALKNNLPIVALESAVVTHGLPHPQNLELASELEDIIRKLNVTPATIALLGGRVCVGLDEQQLLNLATAVKPRKISRSDFGIAIARGESGGTTVAGTLIASHLAGIKVFATGGIGGVHRDAPYDVSADLQELGRTPVVVVCAGAKSILDLPATLEVLETIGVTVIGYQTNEFPAFYSTSSGLILNLRIETPQEAAEIAQAQWNLGLKNAILVVVPPPAENALPAEKVDSFIIQAVREARERSIRGPAVTPYLLQRVNQLSGGSSLQVNLALLRNNARVAAEIANCLSTAPGFHA